MEKLYKYQVLFFSTVLFVSLLIVSSCDQDKDVENPTSNLFLKSFDYKTNNCTYTFEAMDNTAIKSLNIYKNDSLLYNEETTERKNIESHKSIEATCRYTSDGYKIRAEVTDFGGNISEQTVNSPVISSISSPKSGEKWIPNTTYTINWISDSSEKVNIDLYLGSDLLQRIASNLANSGKYLWMIPSNLPASANYKIKVSNTVVSSASSFSNVFEIIPYITITYPTTSVNVYSGNIFNITWTDNITGNLKIDLYKGGSYYSTIASSVSSTSYNWTIPASLPSGDNYKIRISENSTISSVYSETPYLNILIPYIQIINPTSSTSWKAGTNQTITWSGTSTGNVKIELYKSSKMIQTISPSTPNVGNFLWTVPDTCAGFDYSIIATDINNSKIFSKSNFSIALTPYIRFVEPAISYQFIRGEKFTIKWNSNVVAESLKVELVNGSTVLQSIGAFSNVPKEGSCSWVIPSLSIGYYTLRLTGLYKGENYSSYSVPVRISSY